MFKIDVIPVKKIIKPKFVDIDHIIDGIGPEIEPRMISTPERHFHNLIEGSKLSDAVKAKYLPKNSK